MKNHIANIKSLAHQLGEVGNPIAERELISKIIGTLPIDYKAFVSSWRHVLPEKKTLLTLTSLILQEEREIAKWTPKPSGSQELAFHAQEHQGSQGSSGQYRKQRGRGRGRYQSQHSKGQNPNGRHDHAKGDKLLHCLYCGKDNHEIEDCYIKKRHDRTDMERAELAKKMKMADGSAKVANSSFNESP
jgi:hypothetical protein